MSTTEPNLDYFTLYKQVLIQVKNQPTENQTTPVNQNQPTDLPYNIFSYPLLPASPSPHGTKQGKGYGMG